jgi:hypothetical protein
MPHIREPRFLGRKMVEIFTLVAQKSRGLGTGGLGMTQELQALVLGFSHHLNIIIGIALKGALKLGREYGMSEALQSFLDKLAAQRSPSACRMMAGAKDGVLHSQRSAPINTSVFGVTYGFRSLSPEIAGVSPLLDVSQDFSAQRRSSPESSERPMCRLRSHYHRRLCAPWHIPTLAFELYSVQNMWDRFSYGRDCQSQEHGCRHIRDRRWRKCGPGTHDRATTPSKCGSLRLVPRQHSTYYIPRRRANHDILHRTCLPRLPWRFSGCVAPRAVCVSAKRSLAETTSPSQETETHHADAHQYVLYLPHDCIPPIPSQPLPQSRPPSLQEGSTHLKIGRVLRAFPSTRSSPNRYVFQSS